MTETRKAIIEACGVVFLVLVQLLSGVHAEQLSKDDLERFWKNTYTTIELDQHALDPKLSRTQLTKASPDECFYGIGNENNEFNPQYGNLPLICSGDGTSKINQAYVWGFTKNGNMLWFGTAPNVHCMVMGKHLQAPIPNETNSWVCEFGQSKFSPSLPEAIGDWRPPRIFMYDLHNKMLVEKTPLSDPLISQTLGIRSAGSLGSIVILGGPSLNTGINLFAFNTQTGLFLGSTTLTEYSNIRKWLVVNDVLYTAVGGENGGRVLRWTGFEESPFRFEEVGKLGNESGAELAFHKGRLFVSTWPGSAELTPSESVMGLHMSPVISPTGLTAANADGWTKVWSATDYEPDAVTAATYGGGALASFNGYLYWGTMHVPLMSALANINFYSQLIPGYPDEVQALAAALGTYRAISIFRGRNFGQTAETELVYGLTYLPKFTYDPNTSTGEWEIVPNAMGKTPVMGLSGFGNFFNNYTWTMATYQNQLFVGTMDWSYLLYDLAKTVLVPWVNNFSESTISWPPFYFGADLWRFPESGLPAASESVDGVDNYANYGIRTMISDDALYLGMANPMNLFPLGGWEILALEDADTDNDGVSDIEEDGGPINGDGNGDGILDKIQSNVVSQRSASSQEQYLTIEIRRGCGQIRAARVMPEMPADPDYDYPFGLVGFQFFWPCDNVTVRVYFHGAKSLNSFIYRQYGSTPPGFNQPHYYTLPGVTAGNATIGGTTVAYNEFTLVDGALGDTTGVDGYIFARGGPARSVKAIPTANQWGIIIFSILISILGLLYSRKRSSVR